MSLEDAVRFAEMDGVVMIRDLNLGKGFERYYLDTARNREILKHYETREGGAVRAGSFSEESICKVSDVVDVYSWYHITGIV